MTGAEPDSARRWAAQGAAVERRGLRAPVACAAFTWGGVLVCARSWPDESWRGRAVKPWAVCGACAWAEGLAARAAGRSRARRAVGRGVRLARFARAGGLVARWAVGRWCRVASASELPNFSRCAGRAGGCFSSEPVTTAFHGGSRMLGGSRLSPAHRSPRSFWRRTQGRGGEAFSLPEVVGPCRRKSRTGALGACR